MQNMMHWHAEKTVYSVYRWSLLPGGVNMDGSSNRYTGNIHVQVVPYYSTVLLK